MDIARGVRCHAGRDRRAYDCLIHRAPSGGVVIELERAGPRVDVSTHLEKALRSIIATPGLRPPVRRDSPYFQEPDRL